MLALFLLTTLSLAQEAGSNTKYTIQVQLELVAPYTVDIDLATNLPDNALVSVRIELKGQEPKDIFIGTEFEKVEINDGSGHVVIDGNLASYPMGEDLPPGIYEVVATFYPRWRENRKIASEIGVVEDIREFIDIKLQD